LSSLILAICSVFTGFIAFSTYPELAKRVKLFSALGPVTTCSHATSPLLKITNLPEPLLRVCNLSFWEAWCLLYLHRVHWTWHEVFPNRWYADPELGMNSVLLKNLFLNSVGKILEI